MSLAYSLNVRRDRTFFTGVAVIAAVAVFAGFANTYYLKVLYGTPALPALLHVHGLIFSGWMLLFIVQSALVRAGHTSLHRRLGVFGAVLALSMIIVGFITGLERARDAVMPAQLLVFALGDIAVFAPLVTAAVYFRRRPQIHKRLMLLATVSIIDAGTARWPIWPYVSGDVIVQVSLAYAVRDLFVLAAMVHDWRTHGQVHPVYWSAGLAVIAADPLRLALYTTAPWLAFTNFLLR